MPRRNKLSKRRNRIPRGIDPVLGSLRPAYKGQNVIRVVIPHAVGILTTTVTSGLIANSNVLNLADLANSADFASTWDEWRLVAVEVEMYCLTVSTGVTRFWFDDQDTSAPTVAEAVARPGITLPNNSAAAPTKHVMKWFATDDIDYAWNLTSSPSINTVSFKVYTDSAIFGAPTAVTNLWTYVFHATFDFRGIGDN